LSEDLDAVLATMAVVLQPVLRVLAGRDLVRDTAVGTLDNVPRWVVTETGEGCLAMLDERGREGRTNHAY
jgi:hypothetical protein